MKYKSVIRLIVRYAAETMYLTNKDKGKSERKSNLKNNTERKIILISISGQITIINEDYRI